MQIVCLAMRLGFVAPLAVLAAPAVARWRPDRPMRTQTVKDANGGEISCTFYRDMMIRVPGTDTPSPDDAVLVRTGRTPPICSGRTPAGTALSTAAYGFAGRSGVYLFFEEASSNGSVAFRVIDSRTGRTIIDDATGEGIADPSSIKALVATPEALQLSLRRSLNTQCSVLAKPSACWREIGGDKGNGVPPEIARLAPPVQACARSYREARVEHDDPSIVTYDVTVRWTRGGGRNRVAATGPIGCWPMP